MKITGAQLIVKKLAKHGIKTIFEFPGGSICPILDELGRYSKIKTIVTHHEQAAIHATDSISRITKKAGVCMATSGPGASNLITGIANAYIDSVPLVVITGQVAEWDLKKASTVRQRGFQELDIVSVCSTITKKSYLVNKLSDLPEIIDEAFFIAQDSRPGPVLIDIPINLQYTSFDFSPKKRLFKHKKSVCSNKTVEEVVKKLIISKKPLVIVGRGVILSCAEDLLLKILKKYHFPVAQTLMGISALPNNYDFNLGMVGYAGSRIANSVVKEADFILGLGLRFANRAFPDANKEFSKDCYIVHVDCDKAELNYRVLVNKAILSDVKEFLELIYKKLTKYKYLIPDLWLRQIQTWQKELKEGKENKNRMHPQYILTRLSEMLKDKKIIITTDVGQHQLWTAKYFKFNRTNTLVTSGGLGTMGFGLPAAIGAKIAEPESEVINITSDGSFQMNIQELATIKEYKLPVKIILLNNCCLGLVRQIQEFAFCKRYESTRSNSNVDFVNISKGYGIDAFSVTKSSQVDSALKRIVQAKESLLVDFRINEFENFFPIRIKGKVLYK